MVYYKQEEQRNMYSKQSYNYGRHGSKRKLKSIPVIITLLVVILILGGIYFLLFNEKNKYEDYNTYNEKNKQYGTVQRALLGIRGGSIGSSLMDDRQPIDKSGKTLADKAKELGVVEGVWVSEIVENGSAAGADIKVDDVIIGVDNKKVSNMADLQEALAKHRPGDKVKVKLMRDKKEKTVEVTLKNEQGTTKIVKDAGMEILGAAFKELPDDLKKQLNLGYGLQVTGVSSGKMSDAGVRKGFIILKANDQPMRKVSDLEEVMKAAVKSPNQVLFLTGVFPSGKRGYFAVDLTQE